MRQHHADVPEQYYETLRLMDNSASDLDILSCSEIVGLYDRTVIQVRSKVDSWLNDNTVVTGAQSDHTDAPRPRRVRVAYTTVRRKEAAQPRTAENGSCQRLHAQITAGRTLRTRS